MLSKKKTKKQSGASLSKINRSALTLIFVRKLFLKHKIRAHKERKKVDILPEHLNFGIKLPTCVASVSL